MCVGRVGVGAQPTVILSIAFALTTSERPCGMTKVMTLLSERVGAASSMDSEKHT